MVQRRPWWGQVPRSAGAPSGQCHETTWARCNGTGRARVRPHNCSTQAGRGEAAPALEEGESGEGVEGPPPTNQ